MSPLAKGALLQPSHEAGGAASPALSLRQFREAYVGRRMAEELGARTLSTWQASGQAAAAPASSATAAMAAAAVSEGPGRAALRAGASLKARKVIDTGRAGSNQRIWIKWAAGAAR